MAISSNLFSGSRVLYAVLFHPRLKPVKVSTFAMRTEICPRTQRRRRVKHRKERSRVPVELYFSMACDGYQHSAFSWSTSPFLPSQTFSMRPGPRRLRTSSSYLSFDSATRAVPWPAYFSSYRAHTSARWLKTSVNDCKEERVEATYSHGFGVQLCAEV